MMTQCERAALIALKAHKGQKDKGGAPYILHLLTVAMDVKEHGDKAIAVGFLHDYLEDRKGTVDDLKGAGVHPDVIEAVVILTRGIEPYKTYIHRIAKSGNRLAFLVKKADLLHNMDLSRINTPTQTDVLRTAKYREALFALERDAA